MSLENEGLAGETEVSEASMAEAWAEAEKKVEALESGGDDAPPDAAETRSAAEEDGRVVRRERKAAEGPVSSGADGAQGAAPEDSGDAEKFQELAAKLGYQVQDGEVLNREHIALRRHQKAVREKETQISERFERLAREFEARAAGGLALQKAIEESNFDAIAKATGYDSFTEMTREYVEQAASPERRELKQIRTQIELDRKERAAQRNREEQEAAARAHQAQVAEYYQSIAADLSRQGLEVSDGLLEDVVHVQRQYWDGQSTISTAEAAKIVLDTYRDYHARIGTLVASTASGAERVPSGEALETVAESKRAKRSQKTVPRSVAAETSMVKTADDVSDDEYFKYWSSQLEKSDP